MLVLRTLVIGALVSVGFLALGDTASAANCAKWQRVLRQAQAAGHYGNQVISRQALAREGCFANLRSRPAQRLAARPQPQFNARSAGKRRANRGSAGASIQPAGTYRTWCVRTCDGYYFPISFSTRRDQFATDEATCQQMCPGTEARLFTHPAGDTSRAGMESLKGEAYAALPTAFQYRVEISPSCTCNTPAGEQTAAFLSTELPRPEPETTSSVPQPRPAPGEDPESIANQRGGFGFSPGDLVRHEIKPAAGKPREVAINRDPDAVLLTTPSSAGPSGAGAQAGLLLPRLLMGYPLGL